MKDVSINAAVKNAIHKDELRKIVSKACEDGKLSEDSKACKYVEKDVD
jgi:hydroxymethylglutaryl-CoA reductase